MLFDATELGFWCSTMRSFYKLSIKALSILMPSTTTYLCESGDFSLLHLKSKYLKRKCLNTWNHLHVSLSNCGPSRDGMDR